jgi:hypothetical protein
MRLLPFVAAAVFLVSSALAIAGQNPPDVSKNGLVRDPNARVRLAYIRPGADFSKYRTIELAALQFPTSVRDAAPSGSTRRFRESYVLRDQDAAALREDYARMMRDELGKAGYSFVTARRPDTLVVAAQVLRIRLNAPIESSRLSYSGSGRTYSRGAGSITVGAVLADGETGHVLAQVADQYVPTGIWGINNSVTNRAEARRAFRKWASALRRRLGERPTSLAKSTTQD